jgi:hypothetical protein
VVAVASRKKSKGNEQLSNNFLVVLLFFAIVVSIIGTWSSLNKITGYGPTDTGIVNVTVNSSISITLRDANVGVSAVNFTLNQGDTDDTEDGSPAPFNMTNDGAVQVNVTVNATTLFTELGDNHRYFQGKFSNVSSIGTGCNTTTDQDEVEFTNLGFNLITIDKVDWGPDNDTCAFEINVSVTSNISSGEKTSTVTFSAIDSTLG